MKRLFKSLFIVLTSTIALSGCYINVVIEREPNQDKHFDGTTGNYSLINCENEVEIDTLKKGDVSFKYIENQPLLPYLSIDSYISLFSCYYLEGVDHVINDSNGKIEWQINKDNKPAFYSLIDMKIGTISLAGDIDSLLTTAKDYSKSSLNLEMEMTPRKISAKYKSYVYDIGNYDYIVEDNKTYLPLSLLDCTYSSVTGMSHLFNYQRIVQYSEAKQLSTVKYSNHSAYEEMKEYASGELNMEMPQYLLDDRYNAMIYIFENMYGLKTTKSISSMEKYLTDNFQDKFKSKDNAVRNEAYASFIASLNDGHTGVTDGFLHPWNTGVYQSRGDYTLNMMNIYSNLSAKKNAFYQEIGKKAGDVIYFNNDKAAFFSFDAFTFAENAYDDNDNLREDLYNDDTYFFFKKVFKEIDDKGGVTDVVIDISTNGGGVVGTMFKMIALMSRGGGVKFYFNIDNVQEIDEYTVYVNTPSYAYGQKFKFHILTSGYSFSCGNAFPFYARKNKIATIIGQKSAGGECTVDENHLPSGECLRKSSLNHIGWYDTKTKTFEGDEPGVEPDVLIDYEDFYDLTKLAEVIS